MLPSTNSSLSDALNPPVFVMLHEVATIVTAIEESFHQTCSDAPRGASHNHCFVDILVS
jgi:hypothetical protein